GELQRRGVHVAAGRWAGRIEGGRRLRQGDHRHRELVHPVRTGQLAHLRVREARVEPGGQAGRVGECEQLGQHGPGVPVDVPVAAFAVAPAGAPWNPGDDHGRTAVTRWRPDLYERVVERSYQCTPAGSVPPGGTTTYSSSGKRPPADPAARNGWIP